MKYYHATTEKGFLGIIDDFCIKTGTDDIVYLADSDLNARKFIALRAVGEPLYVFEIEFPKKETAKIEETFDHSFQFFQCKAYGYPGNIPMDWVAKCVQYPAR